MKKIYINHNEERNWSPESHRNDKDHKKGKIMRKELGDVKISGQHFAGLFGVPVPAGQRVSDTGQHAVPGPQVSSAFLSS